MAKIPTKSYGEILEDISTILEKHPTSDADVLLRFEHSGERRGSVNADGELTAPATYEARAGLLVNWHILRVGEGVIHFRYRGSETAQEALVLEETAEEALVLEDASWLGVRARYCPECLKWQPCELFNGEELCIQCRTKDKEEAKP